MNCIKRAETSCILAAVLFSNVVLAGQPMPQAADPRVPTLVSLWQPAANVAFVCSGFLPGEVSAPTLVITEKAPHPGRRLFTSDADDTLVAAFTTSELSSNLITTWVTGSSVRVRVFHYDGRSITQVLEASSKIMPEFVYSTDPSFKMRDTIVVTQEDWVKPSDKKDSVLIPVSADVYTWDGARYQRKNVPWASRFAQ
jgi:hypothetical protein